MFVFDDSLREELKDPEYRQAYADDYLNTYVATQIQVLREQRGFTQEKLAELIGTKQPGVSRLENVNYSAWNTETLRKIAHALGVRLRISFETYGDLLMECTSFGRRALQRPNFEQDPGIFPAEAMSYYFIGANDAPILTQTEMAGLGHESTAQIRGSSNDVLAA
ncbi:MAG TPA: helix-turn-helix transcriptional regulator [Candidatus Acidoferrum sp.]|nr:helix-turn-helix transcriptional regulator [Candidatus Acidoferrum sp.]